MRAAFARSTLLMCAASGLVLAALAMPAAADEAAPANPSSADILDVLVQKKILTRQEADKVLTDARKRAEEDAGAVRVPYLPEATREKIKDEVQKEVIETAKREGWAEPGSLPEWLNRFTFSGDARVRMEGKSFQAGNTPFITDVNKVNDSGSYKLTDVPPYLDTTEDRYRARVRARLGVDAKVNDYISAGVRIVTGTLTDPVSTNETLAGDFDKLSIGLDRAYVRVKPFAGDAAWGDTVLNFGKFDNPFFSSEIMFDRDLQFDGAAANAVFAANDGLRLFATAGIFPLEEFAFTSHDKYLVAGQIGASIKANDTFRFKIGAAYYDFENVQGEYNTLGLRDNDYTAPDRVQFGNSIFNLRQDSTVPNTVLLGLASEFRVAALTVRGEADLSPTLIAAIDAEGLYNTGFDEADLAARSVADSSGETAWQVTGTIGTKKVSAFNDWQLKLGYRYLEANSTLDVFTDSDFGLGGTDQEGFVVQGSWGLATNVSLDASWYSARTIDFVDPITSLPVDSVDIDTFQLDLSAKF